WAEALGAPRRYPAALPGFLAECASHGQSRPTPLLLRYGAGGFNCLLQGPYGEIALPPLAVIPLSGAGRAYTGGGVLLLARLPRGQAAGTAIVPRRGELVVFPNRERPVRGTRGWYRVGVRHGASRILSGRRDALAIIFHDAR